MGYVFYADVFWLNQFLLHTAILLLAGELHGSSGGGQRHSRNHFPIRCIAASAFGSSCAAAVLLLSHSYYVYLAAVFSVILPLMTFLAFGRSSPTVFLRRYVSCFAVAVLLGGLVIALENISGIAQVPLLSAFLAFLIAGKWLRFLMHQRQIRRLLCPIIIRQRGREIRLTGLLDTGNLLRDPISGRPVHLLRTSALEACGITESDFAGLVPYQALGSSEGLLAVYRVEALRICRDGTGKGSCRGSADKSVYHRQKDAKSCESAFRDGAKKSVCRRLKDVVEEIRPALIAGAPDELFYGKEYDAILNSAVTVPYPNNDRISLQQ